MTSGQVEILPGRMYLRITGVKSQSTADSFYFSIDDNPDYMYRPFYQDFGPLSLLQIHKFWVLSNVHLKQHGGKVYFTCGAGPANSANGVYLAAAFRMIQLNMSADNAFKPFEQVSARLKPFRDASTAPSTHNLTVLMCLRGLRKAIDLGWYNTEAFDVEDWEKYEQVEHGDMNWLIPGKLLAFATAYNSEIVNGWRVMTPDDLVPVFAKKGITCIVRLCEKFYDKTPFVDAGFKHVEMQFRDGSTPPSSICEKFLKLIDGPSVIALHCKAGLGRTGTLAGCHMMKKYGFTGDEAIGWLRICRPGSVIGPQQHYLRDLDRKSVV